MHMFNEGENDRKFCSHQFPKQTDVKVFYLFPTLVSDSAGRGVLRLDATEKRCLTFDFIFKKKIASNKQFLL